MKSIGIKLADGSFYPILKEGSAEKKTLDVTTVKDNQTTVQIDVYRSETGSMDDAEYVDSLEIKNLIPHPNGEPSLQLDLSLDKDNKLQAEVLDPETGKRSATQVSLISRTLAEREAPAEFSISEVAENPPASLLAGIGGIDDIPDATVDDAFFDAPPVFSDDNLLSDVPLSDDALLSGETQAEGSIVDKDGTSFSFEDTTPDEGSGRTFDLPDFDDIETDTSSTDLDEAFKLPDFEEIAPTSAATDDGFDLPDFTPEPPAHREPGAATAPESAAEPEDTVPSSTFDFDLPDFSLPETDGGDSVTDAGDVPSAHTEPEPATEPAAPEAPADDFDLPDFSPGAIDLPDFTAPQFEGGDSGTDVRATPAVGSADDDFDVSSLPDFDTDSDGGSTDVDFDMSDFRDTADAAAIVADLPDFDDPFSSFGSGTAGTDFTVPDFDDSPSLLSTDEDDSDTRAAYARDAEDSGKARPYAVICVACAVICVAAVLLVFASRLWRSGQGAVQVAQAPAAASATASVPVREQDAASSPAAAAGAAPSAQSGSADRTGQTEIVIVPPLSQSASPAASATAPAQAAPSATASVPAQEQAAAASPARTETLPPVVVPPAPGTAYSSSSAGSGTTSTIAAQEDTIVISTRPQSVVPAPPARPAQRPADSKYTVVWGDTLWDIANAYYKNPWRYTRIAEYNNIRNPNYIQSGQVLLIPAE